MMYILLCDKMIRHQHNKNQKIDLFLSWQKHFQGIITIDSA